MEGLEELLNNPEGIAQILSMASSFAMPESSESNQFPIDENMIFTLMQVLQQLQSTDSKQDALLCALKPYLAPDRQAKLDKAMQLARLSKIAGIAFQNPGGLMGK